MPIQDFELNALQTGASNEVGQADTPSIISPRLTKPSSGYGQYKENPASTSLEDELALIRGASAGIKGGSGGLGGTVGAGLGTAGGAVAGGLIGGPVGAGIGAAAGGGLGGSIGSIVDWAIDDAAQEKAERRELTARRKLLKKKKRKQEKAIVDANRAKYRGIATSREEAAQQAYQAKKSQRENYMFEIMQDLQKQGQTDNFIREKLLNSRSI